MKKLISSTFIFILLMSLAGCGADASTVTVQAAAAKLAEIETFVEISGVLLPEEAVNIASKISGKVSAADFEVGDEVSKGQLLIQLDTTEISAQLAAARAAYGGIVDQVKQAKIPMDSAASDLKRTQSLFDEGAASQVQLDQAKAAYDSAKARYDAANSSGLAQAKAAVDSVAAQLENTKIVSPMDGVITTKNIYAGELASPGVTLAAAANISSLKLKGTISQEFFPFLQKEQPVSVTVDAFSGNTYEGVISLLGPVSVGAGSYFPIELTIGNSGDITAGLSAHSVITVTGSKGVSVPVEAIVKDGAETCVFVIEDNTVSRRIVKTGLGNSLDIEITDGLAAGELVATTKVNVLTDGMTVHITD